MDMSGSNSRLSAEFACNTALNHCAIKKIQLAVPRKRAFSAVAWSFGTFYTLRWNWLPPFWPYARSWRPGSDSWPGTQKGQSWCWRRSNNRLAGQKETAIWIIYFKIQNIKFAQLKHTWKCKSTMGRINAPQENAFLGGGNCHFSFIPLNPSFINVKIKPCCSKLFVIIYDTVTW